jgi:hypothetical protein
MGGAAVPTRRREQGRNNRDDGEKAGEHEHGASKAMKRFRPMYAKPRRQGGNR